ncbi:hypothetical protein [Pseudonocardia sp. DSM 110487]|nr:hypothetical protein [Pseudonocardia sp. DSM 110487]
MVHGTGLSGLRSHIREHVALAAKLADRVRADPAFELAPSRRSGWYSSG